MNTQAYFKVNNDTRTFWRWMVLRGEHVIDFGYELSESAAIEVGQCATNQANKRLCSQTK